MIWKKEKGFTLVEMLVAISIFFIVTAVVLINIPDFKKKVSIDLVANQVAVNIRGAQAYTTGTKLTVTELNPVRYEYFGIKLNNINTEYSLYGADDKGELFQLSSIMESYELEEGFIFSDFRCGGDDAKELEILFERPNPSPSFRGDEDSCTYLSVGIKSIDGSQSKTINVYGGGYISIDN